MSRKKNMKIIVVGAGSIGSYIASDLSRDGGEVTVIDVDGDKVENMTNSADVIGFKGNGASYNTLNDLGASDADVVIAVSDSDEINILSCFTAHTIGAKHTIARIRDVDYANQNHFYKRTLGISMIINPDLASANEIFRTLRFPVATRIELFAGGKAELVEMTIDSSSPLIGHNLMEIRQNMGMNLLVCAVVREGEAFVPKGNVVIKNGDTIYLTGAANEFRPSFKKIGVPVRPLRSVLIAGNDRTAYYLGSILEKSGIKATIVDQDRSICRKFAEQLPKAAVMNEDALRYFDSLSDTEIANIDAFIAITMNDEYNLISAMYAESKGIGKVIAKVSAKSRLKVLPQDTRINTLSREDVAADRILGYTRALLNADDNDAVESLYRLLDGDLEFVEFNIMPDDQNLNIPLKQLKFKKNVLLAGIIRDSKTIIPNGDDHLEPYDVAIVVSVAHQIAKIEDVYE